MIAALALVFLALLGALLCGVHAYLLACNRDPLGAAVFAVFGCSGVVQLFALVNIARDIASAQP